MVAPILYCHGLLGTRDEGDILSKKFEHAAEWHSFNFMDHGGNHSHKEWSIEYFSEDLIDYIKQHELINPIIIGYSLGGYVALFATMKKRIFPRQLICYGTKWFWDLDFVAKEHEKMNLQFLSEKAPAVLKKWSQLHDPIPVEVMLEKTRNFMTKMTQEQPWTREELCTLNTEVAICTGVLDKFISTGEANEMLNRLPNARHFSIPNSGHTVNTIDIEEWSRVIKSICQLT